MRGVVVVVGGDVGVGVVGAAAVRGAKGWARGIQTMGLVGAGEREEGNCMRLLSLCCRSGGGRGGRVGSAGIEVGGGAGGAGAGVDAGGGWYRCGAFLIDVGAVGGRTGGRAGRWTWGGHVRALAWDGTRGCGGPGPGRRR